jgi:4-amino-4-deoxy-L-arabinose transferase-like glycosyltransferase
MITKKNINNTFYLFLFFHLIIWTLVPTFSNINLPLDTIEALAWGSNLGWGFDKHPPMSAFAVEFFYYIFGRNDWAYYFLSQIFIIIGFYIVFKFSKEFFRDTNFAFLSVLLLEGINYYNFTSPEFNVNVCQIPFWTLSVYFTWRCFKYDKTFDFIFLGLFIGLGILSKYLFVYLVIGIILFFIFLIKKKKKIKLINYFIAGFIALLILFPHLIWLYENNFTTFTYGLKRAGGTGGFYDHLIHPLVFLAKQVGILTPFFVMSFLLIKKIKFKINLKDEKLIFLLFTTLAPLLLIIFTSTIAGVKIRTMWMTPFYLFSGVFILFIFQKNIFLKNFKKFLFSFLFFFLLSPIAYIGISIGSDTKRTDYPGKEIARLVENKWKNNFKNEIKIVVGDEWSAGNLSYHLSSRPKWMYTLENKISSIEPSDGIIYTGNPKILKEVCPGVFGTISPVGYCMIGVK